MQRGYDHTIPATVEKRKREALVSPGVMEWAESNQANVTNGGRETRRNFSVLAVNLLNRAGGLTDNAEIVGQHLRNILTGDTMKNRI